MYVCVFVAWRGHSDIAYIPHGDEFLSSANLYINRDIKNVRNQNWHSK